MKSSKKKIIVIITILLVVGVLGTTYALWSVSDKSKKIDEVTATCLDIEFSSEDSGITLNDVIPVVDREGLMQEGYTFKITNKCDSIVRFYLNLESLNISNDTKYTNIDYIDISLNDDYVEGLGNFNSTTSLLDEGTAYDTRLLEENLIKPQGTAVYILKVWLDEDTPKTEANSMWRGKITVSATTEANSDYLDLNGVQYLTKLATTNTDELYYDGASYTDPNTNEEIVDNNLRYMGANPNNYVLFNDELWRIIGVMNNVDDGSGVKESRIKLIRAESLGQFPYYDECADENWTDNGNGTYTCSSKRYNNNWPNSTVNEILNDLYWNGKLHEPYHGYMKINDIWKDSLVEADFGNSKINKKTLKYIKEAIYYLGGHNAGIAEYNYLSLISLEWYEAERTNQGNNNELTWTGNLGLMYPSDYGYASNGVFNGTDCKEISLYTWNIGENEICKNSD